jgi:hypothetical protein
MKSVDENLKSQLKQFWKYVASFRKTNSPSIQLEVDSKHLIETCDVAGTYSNDFQSAYSNPCPVVFPTHSSSPKSLSIVLVSDSDTFKSC